VQKLNLNQKILGLTHFYYPQYSVKELKTNFSIVEMVEMLSYCKSFQDFLAEKNKNVIEFELKGEKNPT
jgi:hypothetical protein